MLPSRIVDNVTIRRYSLNVRLRSFARLTRACSSLLLTLKLANFILGFGFKISNLDYDREKSEAKRPPTTPVLYYMEAFDVLLTVTRLALQE